MQISGNRYRNEGEVDNARKINRVGSGCNRALRFGRKLHEIVQDWRFARCASGQASPPACLPACLLPACRSLARYTDWPIGRSTNADSTGQLRFSNAPGKTWPHIVHVEIGSAAKERADKVEFCGR